ncbi:anhydro-N-acetylmuramic acid kinase [Roseateles oligotrophus]|uniref:Anhydro-N-acetylmuramic acid kinase n=1 Tax=Roseateles oligotrophus TaxID=1769250 RepID=A0ABT2YES9_9BURK|nr:anhydro-N-acetylmuramic acid kinase [Roseateles oligotrophus]MCV2368556.1 anhydro-N-acetylmuramic acid kinase [Roseateles oligotrophus]
MGSELFIGLMSGTSLDGVDALLARFPAGDTGMHVLGHLHRPFCPSLREELLALNSPGDNELHRAALAGNAVARDYADLVSQLLELCGVKAGEVAALGAHGQTVRHRPGEFDGCGYSIQLLNGALLAEQSGIAVVCDLRSRDVAAGGQGAPLVPAFHRAQFAQPGRDIAVVNIGGISNISLLSGAGGTLGFDCGPGNCLMDAWAKQHLGHEFDAGGAWAAEGQVLPGLLEQMLGEPFFGLTPPRSTGRDLFNRAWLDRCLDAGMQAVDVQASLLELSVQAIVQSLGHHDPQTRELLVCGGGALNTQLMRRLQACLPGIQVMPTDARGLPVMQVEAAAFAWLAMRHLRRLPGNLAGATGALGPRLLGALYPA